MPYFGPSSRILTKACTIQDDDLYKYDQRFLKKKDWKYHKYPGICCLWCFKNSGTRRKIDMVEVLWIPKDTKAKYNIQYCGRIHGIRLSNSPKYAKV